MFYDYDLIKCRLNLIGLVSWIRKEERKKVVKACQAILDICWKLETKLLQLSVLLYNLLGLVIQDMFVLFIYLFIFRALCVYLFA